AIVRHHQTQRLRTLLKRNLNSASATGWKRVFLSIGEQIVDYQPERYSVGHTKWLAYCNAVERKPTCAASRRTGDVLTKPLHDAPTVHPDLIVTADRNAAMYPRHHTQLPYRFIDSQFGLSIGARIPLLPHHR